jgi:hypothetical protein
VYSKDQQPLISGFQLIATDTEKETLATRNSPAMGTGINQPGNLQQNERIAPKKSTGEENRANYVVFLYSIIGPVI